MEDYLWVLKESERDLMREIEPERMRQRDEDELLALHRRVRRARNKHVTTYRRKAARTVEAEGSRGAARPKGAKARHRAEAFEEALARVSERLAEVAHEQAEQLKAERLERVRRRGSGPAGAKSGAGKVAGSGLAREHEKSTGGLKRDASTRAQGVRRQAAKDAR